jgi:hypothetical protein
MNLGNKERTQKYEAEYDMVYKIWVSQSGVDEN